MQPVLEPGFIARLFDESIYLVRNVSEKENIFEEIPVVHIEKQVEVLLKPLPGVAVRIKKKLLVLTDKKFLTEDENIFISKLITAVALVGSEVAIMKQADFNRDEYDFAYLLQFGSSDKEKYKVCQEQGYSMLVADELDNLTNNLEFKKLLWTSLQQMFKIRK